MKSIIEQINKKKQEPTPIKKDEGVDLDALMMQEVTNSVLYYLRGIYEAYCHYNKSIPLRADIFFQEIEELDANQEITELDQINDTGKFLKWYFQEFK